MYTERGVVVGRDGDRVRVEVTRSAMCAHCSSKDSCHAMDASSKAVVHALNHADADLGDLVEVSLSEGAVLKASALVYLVPVLGLVLGAVAGERWIGPALGADAGAAVGSGLGLLVTVLVVALWSRVAGKSESFSPVVTRVVLRRMGPSFPGMTPNTDGAD